MVVGDFPIETDTLVIGSGPGDMLPQFAQHSLDRK